MLANKRAVKKYFLCAAVLISLLPLGCTNAPVKNSAAVTTAVSSIYDGTYSGTFTCAYRTDANSPWVTVTAFTLTVTFKTDAVSNGVDYMWVSHVSCSDPVYGAVAGVDMTDGFLSVASLVNIGNLGNTVYSVPDYGYAWLPLKTPASVSTSVAFMINFPNGTGIDQAGGPFIVTTGGTSISGDSPPPAADSLNFASWISVKALLPSAIPRGAITGPDFKWMGLAWSLTRIPS
ncbi:MAG: hypothetical protein ACLPVI_10580 [Dehalococcoidales bacterium]